MADSIQNIIDVGGFQSDLAKVISGIATLEKDIDDANAKSILVKVDLQGADGLAQIYSGLQKVQTQLESYTQVQQKATVVAEQLNTVSQEYGATTATALEYYAKLKLQIYENNGLMAKYSSAIDNATESMKGLSSMSASVRAQLGAGYTETINNSKEAIEQLIIKNKLLANEVTKTSQVIIQTQEKTTMAVTAEYNKQVAAAEAKEIKEVNSAVRAAEKKAEAEAIAEQKKEAIRKAAFDKAWLEGEAWQLKQEQLADKDRMIVLRNELRKAEARSAAFNRAWLEGEKWQAQQERAAGKTSMLENLFLRMAIRMALMQLAFLPIIAGVTALVEWWNKVDDATQAAIDRLKDYTDNFKELQKSMIDSVNKTLTDIFGTQQDYDIEKKRMLDHNNSLDDRFNAYKKMQELAPKVLDDMDKTTFATKMNTEAMKEAAEAGNKYIEVQKNLSRVQESRNEQQKSLLDAEREQAAARQNILKELKSHPNFQGKPTGSYSDDDLISIYTGKNKDAQHGLLHETDLQKSTIDFNKTSQDIEKTRKDLAQSKIDVDNLTKQRDEMEGATKDPKGRKPKKSHEFQDELEAEKAHYKLRQDILQADYENSRKTFVEEKQLMEDEKEAANEHADEMLAITRKWKGKVGETPAKFAARLVEIEADRLAVINAKDKKELEIAKEIRDRHDAENKKIDEEISKGEIQLNKLRELQRELEAIKSKGAEDHKYAEGIGGVFEGAFGGDFGEGLKSELKKKGIDIEALKAQRNANDEAQNKYNKTEGATASGSLGFDVTSAKLGNDIEQAGLDKQALIDSKKIEAKKEFGQKVIQLEQAIVDSIQVIRDNQFAAEQQQIDRQLKSVELLSQQKIRSIEASAGYAITKSNEESKVAAATTAKENELQQQSNQLALKKAKADKQGAEGKIVAQTAQAIIEVFAAYAGIPGGVAIAAGLSALIAGIGAAQYAAAASAPLPQFADGGVTESPFFIAGERGPELGVTPSGKAIMFDKPGLYSSEIGTKISSAEETERIIRFATSNLLIPKNNSDKSAAGFSDRRIVEKLDDVADSIAGAIFAARNPQARTEQIYADAVRENFNLISKRNN